MPRKKIEETGFLSKSEKTKLQRLYSSGKAAYGSLKNLQKTSNLSKTKVEKFLQSKESFTKFRQANRKFDRLSAFAKHINEIWCMDLAFVDKLATLNNGVKYLLVSIDVFSRLVRVQPMKSKDAKETVRAFEKMITAKSKPKKIWVDKGTEFAGAFKKFCQDRKITIYSTMSETKAAYAERAIRSLKNIIYRFMEENGYKYIHKLNNFVSTMNTRTNRSIKMVPAQVKNSDYLKIFYRKPMKQYNNPKFKIGDNVRISKNDIPFRKGYKPQYTNEVFEIEAISTRKPPTYILKDDHGETILGKFYQKELTKCII